MFRPLAAVAPLVLTLSGCANPSGRPAAAESEASSDDQSDTLGDIASDVSGSGDPCENTPGDAGAGASCTHDSDCASGFCAAFAAAPPDAAATCAAPPESGIRVTGRAIDLTTGDALPGADTSLGGLGHYYEEGHSFDTFYNADANGAFDLESAVAIEDPVALVVEVSEAISVRAAAVVVLADPEEYDHGTGARDVWVVSDSTAASWADELAAAGFLSAGAPLLDAAIVAGVVRDGAGERLPGQRLSAAAPASGAQVAYLQPGGTFSDVETSETGVVVIVGAEVGEFFAVDAQTMDPRCVPQMAIPAVGAITTIDFVVDP